MSSSHLMCPSQVMRLMGCVLATQKGSFTITTKTGKVFKFQDDQFGIAQTLFEEEFVQRYGEPLSVSNPSSRGIHKLDKLMELLKPYLCEDSVTTTYTNVCNGIRAQYNTVVELDDAADWITAVKGDATGLVKYSDDAELAFLQVKYPQGMILQPGYFLLEKILRKSDYSEALNSIFGYEVDLESVPQEDTIKEAVTEPDVLDLKPSKLVDEEPVIQSGELTDDGFDAESFLSKNMGRDLNSIPQAERDYLLNPIPAFERELSKGKREKIPKAMPKNPMRIEEFLDTTIENLAKQGIVIPYAPRRILCSLMIRYKGQIKYHIQRKTFSM